MEILKAMFKKREDKSPRTHFGEAGKAWIKIEISEDGRRVFLRELCFGGDASLGFNHIVKALADNCYIQGLSATLGFKDFIGSFEVKTFSGSIV